MNVKQLFVRTLLMGAVATAPVGLSSCDDDDGGGSSPAPTEPEIAEGEATADLTGDREITINADGGVQVTEQGGITEITWKDADSSEVSVRIDDVDTTGVYNMGDGKNAVQVTVGNEVWTSDGGSVGVATNNDNRIAGTFNDVTLSLPGGRSSVTLNGEFNALKNKGGPDDGPDEPSVGKGEAIARITGDAEATIVPDGPINVSTLSVGGQDATIIKWTDTALNSVNVTLFQQGETGTYSAAQTDGEGSVTVTLDGTTWTSGGGEIGVATNNDTRIAGTLNDVSLSPYGGGSGSVTLNGEFNALKNGGGGGTTNQITLSGAAEDTLSFDLAVPASLDAPVVHKRVTLGAEDVVLRIVPQDGTGSISAIADTAVTSDNPPSEGVAVVVNYDGSEWGSTGEGIVEVTTNDGTTVEGTLNDVVVGTEGVDQNVTLNGSFSASQ